jgi:hypothetical protein
MRQIIFFFCNLKNGIIFDFTFEYEKLLFIVNRVHFSN